MKYPPGSFEVNEGRDVFQSNVPPGSFELIIFEFAIPFGSSKHANEVTIFFQSSLLQNIDQAVRPDKLVNPCQHQSSMIHLMHF